ncbi:unnamed protein product [Kuraishia capsulata CBS 1993]|uniref:Uncharacterized protein n=1 Tax=Kuraishia capsulata CBS 1993 TaxID=1382522 RepID=W6MKG0_9ASCO|nr:uncharacterized protein KUCA_T00002460001 [Kuraishia capsulata CBS 1993]CDK26488.1 unnamed protein product [Kuraishia capsulata CBS 1993]
MTDIPRYALVTGASSGIGYATAVELAKRGFKVYAGARRVTKMEPLKEYGIVPIELDVGSLESVIYARDLISAETDGHLDVLFNNAGGPCFYPGIEVKEDVLLQVLNVNVAGVIRVTREFSPLVIKSQGCIAFTGSLSALMPMPFGSVYGATKAAVHSYASGLESELRPFNVKVLNVVTGGVTTEIFSNYQTLASDSLYNVGETTRQFIKQRKETTTGQSTPAAEYAIRVVDQMLNRTRTWRIYEGHAAWLVRWATTLLPDWITRPIFERKFGFNLLADAIAARQSKLAVD